MSIACELVTSPSILFCDEPTSGILLLQINLCFKCKGLDAFNAYNVIECLVSLARNYKRTVIVTIHQPRSNIYALFDQLILLAKGNLIYSGPAHQEAIDHFSQLGYHCPLGFNLADYLVDLSMHASVLPVLPIESVYSEGLDHVNEPINPNDSMNPSPLGLVGPSSIADSLSNSLANSTSNSKGKGKGFKLDISTFIQSIRQEQEELLYSPKAKANSNTNSNSKNQLDLLIQGYQNSSISSHISSLINELNNMDTTHSSSSPFNAREWISNYTKKYSKKARWWTQFRILSGRMLKNLVRNPNLLAAHYLISLLAALFCGTVFWKVENTISGFQNRMGIFFFVCNLFGFLSISSLFVFSSERLIFIKERANRYYTPFTYFLAKLVFEMIPLRVIPPLILGLISYQMIGLRAESIYFLLKFLSVLVLLNLASASVCLAISVLFSDIAVGSVAALLVMLYQMLFAGLLLNKTTIPAMWSWLFKFSFFNFAFEALAVNEVNGIDLIEHDHGLNIAAPGIYLLFKDFIHTK